MTDEEYEEALQLTIKDWEKAKEEGKTKRKTAPTVPFANCAKRVRKKTKGLLLLFNMDFGDTNSDVFSYVLSLPYITNGEDRDIGYEYMGNKKAFKLSDDEQR